LECVEGFLGGFVEDSFIDGFGNRVVDEFTEDETVWKSARAQASG